MKEYTGDELEKTENDITQALLEAVEYRLNKEQRTIVIKRGDRKLFEFKVEGIDEDTWRKCRRQNLKNRGKRNEELDGARFLSQAIYEATVAEDKAIWNNREIWSKLNAVTGADVVNAVLLPGEKAKISEVLEELSGFNDDDLDELIKN